MSRREKFFNPIAPDEVRVVGVRPTEKFTTTKEDLEGLVKANKASKKRRRNNK